MLVQVVTSNNRKSMGSSNSNSLMRDSSRTILSMVGADEAGVTEVADGTEKNEEERVEEGTEDRVGDVEVGRVEGEPAMALIMEVGCTASLAARVQG